MKRCKACLLIKPLDEFYRCSTTVDRLRPECKACTCATKRMRERRDWERTKEVRRRYRRTAKYLEYHADAERLRRLRHRVAGID